MPDLLIQTLDTQNLNFKEAFHAWIMPTEEDEDQNQVEQQVKTILRDIRKQGDVSLIAYTNKLDNRNITNAKQLTIPLQKAEEAFRTIDPVTKATLIQAKERITAYHKKQISNSWHYQDASGVLLGQKIVPIEKVGIYIPGGKANYPSSVLMNAIPAKIAGVESITMVVPAPNDQINALVLAAAYLCEVDRIFSIGGSQAIAALTYGTQTIPKVDKIVGPGNRYVAMAKQMVYGKVGIDMLAGPSEVLIIADGKSPVEWVVLDLFAQAEHDEEAKVAVLCTDTNFLTSIKTCMNHMIDQMERAPIIRKALEKHGRLIAVKNMDEAIHLTNIVAPEHLQIATAKPQNLLKKIKHAGAVFLGYYATAVFGDYMAGTNHVLPTNTTARFSSPLGVYDFQKRIAFMECDQKNVQNLATHTERLARTEQLFAHADAAKARKTNSLK